MWTVILEKLLSTVGVELWVDISLHLICQSRLYKFNPKKYMQILPGETNLKYDVKLNNQHCSKTTFYWSTCSQFKIFQQWEKENVKALKIVLHNYGFHRHYFIETYKMIAYICEPKPEDNSVLIAVI